MELTQQLHQAQKLILTQSMQQSLTCLALPAQELAAYLRDAALSNPVIEIEDIPPELQNSAPDPALAELREYSVWSGSRGGDSYSRPEDAVSGLSRPQSFTEYLDEQLGQMRELDEQTCALCRYLVGCLNTAGYLDCSLSELAAELGCSVFSLEQALFVVQALDPPGVGARDLVECLILQLSRGPYFTACNLHLIQSGLPLLAAGDYAGLASALHVSQAEARRSAAVIRALNPIPSRGFYTETTTPYIIPEAVFRCENGRILVEMNAHTQPGITLNDSYCAMLGQEEYADAQDYLKENVAKAKALRSAVENRSSTLASLLSIVAQQQSGFFLSGRPISPMTMGQVAGQLGLNISTVSRAVKDKYIEFDGKLLLLRKLFSSSVGADEESGVSSAAIQHQMRLFLAAEDPKKPLSDETLRTALEGVGLSVSRRTVAKYRSELGIPPAAKRRARS